jgi:hypothetical protein
VNRGRSRIETTPGAATTTGFPSTMPCTSKRTPAQVVDGVADARLALRVVADAVGVHGEERVRVVGRQDARRRVPVAELRRIAADLRRRVRVHAHELELRVAEDPAQGLAPSVSRRPLRPI